MSIASRYSARMPTSGVIGVSHNYTPEPSYHFNTSGSSPMATGARLGDIRRNLGRLSQALETLREIESSSSSTIPAAYSSPTSSKRPAPAQTWQSPVAGLAPGSEERNRALADAISQSRQRIAALRAMSPPSPPVKNEEEVVEEEKMEIETDVHVESATPNRRLSELESQLESMKTKSERMKDIIRRQQDQVRVVLDEQKNAIETQSASHQAKIEKARKEIKRCRKRIRELEEQSRQLSTAHDELKAKNADLEAELQAVMDGSMKNKQEGKAHKAGAAAAMMRVQALQSRSRELATQRKDAIRQRDEAISSAKQWRERAGELDEQVEDLLAKLQARQTGLSNLKTQYEETERLRTDAESAGRQLARDNEALTAKVTALESGLQDQVKKRVNDINQLDQAAESAVGWKERAEELTRDFDECKTALDNVTEQAEEYKTRAITLDSELSELKRTLKAKEQAMAMLDVEREASTTQLGEQREEAIQQLESAVKARIDAIQERDEAIKSAEEWKKEADDMSVKLEESEGRLEGLMKGRIAVAEENETAVGSAMAWQKRAEELEQDLSEAQDELRAAQQANAVHQAMSDTHKETLDEVESLRKKAGKVNSLQDKLAQMVSARIAVIQERDEILQEREDAVASAEAWKAHAGELETELNDMRSGVESVGLVHTTPPPIVTPVHRDFKVGGDDESFADFEKLAQDEGGDEWKDLFVDESKTHRDVDAHLYEKSMTHPIAVDITPTVRMWREGVAYVKAEGLRLGGFHSRWIVLQSDELILYNKADASSDVNVKLPACDIQVDTDVTVPDRAKHPFRFAVTCDGKRDRHVFAFDNAGDRAKWLADIKNVHELSQGTFSLTSLGLSNTDQVVRRILQPVFVNAVVDGTEIADLDPIAQPIMHVLVTADNKANKAIELIKNNISTELDGTRSAETLFRTNSKATKLLRELTSNLGQQFLTAVLHDVVTDLLIEDGPDFEVDPARLGDDVSPSILATNQQNLRDHVTVVIQNIQDNLSKLPVSVAAISAHLYRAVAAKFPGHEHVILGGVLFLRFICPAILAPHSFNLSDSPPSAVSQRRLTLLTKIIQNVSNDVTFGAKEPFMAALNDVVESAIPRIKDIFESIVAIGEDIHDDNDVHDDVDAAIKCLSDERADLLRLHCLRIAVKLPSEE